jgi:hypothetical protein
MKKYYIKPEIEMAVNMVPTQLICESVHDIDHPDAKEFITDDEDSSDPYSSRNLWDE